MKNTNLIVFLFFGLLFVCAMSYNIGHNQGELECIEKENNNVYSKDYFSEDSLKSFIYSIRLEHPEIVLAQAKIETGFFKSNILKETNNLFGMNNPKIRMTTSNGCYKNYATYKNWMFSVIDYALYQVSYAKGKTKEEYLIFLQKNYAQDPMYVVKINTLIE